jgi:hypothetical protein
MAEEKTIRLTDNDQAAIDMLAEMIGQSEFSFDIKKKHEETGTYAYMGKVEASEFSVEWLAEEYGGGDYFIQVKQNGRFTKKSCELSIHPSIIGRQQRAAEKRAEEKRNAKSADGGSGRVIDMLESMLAKQGSKPDSSVEMLKAQNDATAMMVQQMQAQQQAASQASQTQMQAMMQMMMGMMENSTKMTIAMLSGQPKSDIAGIIASLSPLLSSGARNESQGASGGMKEALELIATTRELFEQPKEEESTFSKVTSLAGDAIAAYLASKGIDPSKALGMGEPQALPTGANPQASIQQTVNDILIKLKTDNARHLPRLLKAADRKRDPGEIAEMIADTLSETESAVMMSALSHHDWIGVLFDGSEEVRKRLPWFDSLRQALLRELADNAGGETPETPDATDEPTYDNGLRSDGEQPDRPDVTTTSLDDDPPPPQ